MRVKDLWTIEQAVEELGVSKATIHRWMKEGKLAYFKLGRKSLFKPEDVQAMLKPGGKAEAKSPGDKLDVEDASKMNQALAVFNNNDNDNDTLADFNNSNSETLVVFNNGDSENLAVFNNDDNELLTVFSNDDNELLTVFNNNDNDSETLTNEELKEIAAELLKTFGSDRPSNDS